MDEQGWVELFKLLVTKPQYLSMAILLTTFFILIVLVALPKIIPSQLLIRFRDRFFNIVLILFLVAATLQLTVVIANYSENRIQRNILSKLTNAEIKILNHLITKKKRTYCSSRGRTESTLKVLEHDEILYLVSEDTKAHYRCYSINRWAYFYLLKHPELLKETPT